MKNLPGYQSLDEKHTGWELPGWAIIVLMAAYTAIVLLSGVAFFFLFVRMALYELYKMGLAPILEFIL